MTFYERLIAPVLRHACQAGFIVGALLLSLAPAVAASEISESLKTIDVDAMSGDPVRIRTSIEEYKKLKTIDSDWEVQWRLLRAYGNLFSELTCRNSIKEQKAAAKAGYKFAEKVDAAHSDKAELVYYYADISGRYYQDRLFKASFAKVFGGFDPIESCKRALKMDENIDYAGPHRCLGALYLMLPGSRDSKKALKHLQQAVAISPDRVANRVWLARALVKVGRYEEAWTYIEPIKAGNFKVGKDVSSEHWARIYMRRVKNINQENIKNKFDQMESEDGCGE